MGNKKAALFLGGFLFESWSSLGAFGFGEPPVVIQCRGDKGHDDGNKRYEGDVEDHGKDGGESAGHPLPCQPQVFTFSN
jgi:hypothetical protein